MENIEKCKNAIEELQASLDYGISEYIDTQSLEFIIEVAKREIPQKVKVKIEECEQNRKYHYCPVCNRWLTSMMNYCNDCGQKLDWGDANG